MKTKQLIGGMVLVLGMTNALAQKTADPTFAMIDQWKTGGVAGWDYLSIDTKRGHLFVTRGTYVHVVDVKTGKVIGDIPGLDNVHGAAIADDLNLGFTSNGGTASVTVFDLETLKVIDTVKLPGGHPDAIVYEPTQKQIYTMNKRSNDLTVIDAKTRMVINTIGQPRSPEFAVPNGKGKMFVNSADAKAVMVIDAKSGKQEAEWSLAPCEGPTGIAYDAKYDRIFSVCGNHKMMVLDGKNGKVVAEVLIGGRADGAAFDAKLGLVFSSNGDGTLTIVRQDDADHYRVTQNLVTKSGARTMTLDPTTHRLYLSSAEFPPMPTPAPDAAPAKAAPAAPVVSQPATPAAPRVPRAIIPDSFAVLVVGLKP